MKHSLQRGSDTDEASRLTGVLRRSCHFYVLEKLKQPSTTTDTVSAWSDRNQHFLPPLNLMIVTLTSFFLFCFFFLFFFSRDAWLVSFTCQSHHGLHYLPRFDETFGEERWLLQLIQSHKENVSTVLFQPIKKNVEKVRRKASTSPCIPVHAQ